MIFFAESGNKFGSDGHVRAVISKCLDPRISQLFLRCVLSSLCVATEIAIGSDVVRWRTLIEATGVQGLYSQIDLSVHAASVNGSSDSLKSISTVALAIANFEALFAFTILWVREPISPSRAVPLVPSVVQVGQILSSNRLVHSIALTWLRPGFKSEHSVVCALVGVKL